ncbi:MAG: proline--tRNA ligase, partial [Candidatus Zixiibacteriota bacterium]
RGREFIMKDAYTFDATEESFDESYQNMVDTYFRIFRRAGLETVKVESDASAMGGKAAHEFMVLVDTEGGEEIIVACDSCDYAANIEKGTFTDTANVTMDNSLQPRKTVDTPNASTIEEVTAFLKVDATRLVKTLVYMADGKPVAALVRGDRDLNPSKLKVAVGATELEMANAEQVEYYTGAPVGFAGPIGLKDMPIVVDPLVSQLRNFIVGANENEKHIVNVNLDRDFKATQVVDITLAREGDRCPHCEGKLSTKTGIEVGNTFMLGTKYSETLHAKYLDADGKEQPILMGSYGIGITRTPQAALEKYHDEKGIIWPKSIAPYLVEIIPISMESRQQVETAEKVYAALSEAGIDVLYDDRDERAGVKFNDADLIGLPIRVVIGDKSLQQGKIELKARSQDKAELVAVDQAVAGVRKLAERIN